MAFFYLSFCDPKRPKGQQFLGATVVEAPDPKSAVDIALLLGINPGGEVAIVSLNTLGKEAKNYLNRFVPREEVMSESYISLNSTNLTVEYACEECNEQRRI